MFYNRWDLGSNQMVVVCINENTIMWKPNGNGLKFLIHRALIGIGISRELAKFC